MAKASVIGLKSWSETTSWNDVLLIRGAARERHAADEVAKDRGHVFHGGTGLQGWILGLWG